MRQPIRRYFPALIALLLVPALSACSRPAAPGESGAASSAPQTSPLSARPAYTTAVPENAEIFRPEDYGVKGDGSTDDGPAGFPGRGGRYGQREARKGSPGSGRTPPTGWPPPRRKTA